LFASLWQIKDRSNIARLIKNSMTNKSVVQLNCEGKSTRGRRALFELILLPLASEANERHLIGMIISLGRPFWLESDPIVETRLQSISIIDPRHPARNLLGDSVLAAPENTASVALPATRAIISRKVRHLLVFDGGKIND